MLHRTIGAVIRAEGGKRVDDQHLASTAKLRHAFSIYVLTQQPATADTWFSSLHKIIGDVESTPLESRLAAHRAWWASFWNRSRVDIHDRGDVKDTPGHDVARGYQLQRFITACAGRGAYPIKFNGSIFTVPHAGGPGDADYRLWGPGYWWQNTRLPYESLCTAGDYDLMQPLFHMYGGEVLAVFAVSYPPIFRLRRRLFRRMHLPLGHRLLRDLRLEAGRRTHRQAPGQPLPQMGLGRRLGTRLPHARLLRLHARRKILAAKRSSRPPPVPTALLRQLLQDRLRWQTGDAPGPGRGDVAGLTNPMPELAGLHAVCERLPGPPGRQAGRRRPAVRGPSCPSEAPRCPPAS